MPSEENDMSAGLSKIAPSKRITGGKKSICRGVVSGALPAAWCDSVKTVSGIVHRLNSSSALRWLIRVEEKQVRCDTRARSIANAERERFAGVEYLVHRRGFLIAGQRVALPVDELDALRSDDVERDQIDARAGLVRAHAKQRELARDRNRKDKRARRIAVRAHECDVVLRDAQRLDRTLLCKQHESPLVTV